MKMYAGKTPENKGRPVAGPGARGQAGKEPPAPFSDRRASVTAQREIREQSEQSPRVRQLQAWQRLFDSRASEKQADTVQRMEVENSVAVSPGAGAVIQRKIGPGGILNHGKLVFGPGGKRYEIVNSEEFWGQLRYKLEDEDGNEISVDSQDDLYRLDTEYTGVLGFGGMDEQHAQKVVKRTAKRKRQDEDSDNESEIPEKKLRRTYPVVTFTVARRDESARTNTIFTNPKNTAVILNQDCGLILELANFLISKADWSYPTLKKLVLVLQELGTMQPGMDVGAQLWLQQQPSKKYTVTTSPHCNPLAQIVGCHLMEYQETNSGTQGPIQQRDESRKKQLRFSQAILQLPSDEVAAHSLGIGQPEHVNLFPGMFDVKFEDNSSNVFLKTAGSVTYKTYQSALKARNQQFDFNDTLLDEARKDRRDKTKTALNESTFEADKMKKFKRPNKNFLKHQFGIKDTDSDHSQEEDESWDYPYSETDVEGWTLNEFHQFIFKHNVYSGVMLKEYSAKLAELDIREKRVRSAAEMRQIEKSRARREGVQNRIAETNEMIHAIMQSLGIKITLVYSRVSEWKKAWQSVSKSKLKSKSNEKALLTTYINKTLGQLKQEGYPTVARFMKENAVQDEDLF